MLISFRKGAFAFAAAATLMATTAQAEELSVLIVDGAYFPDITYANQGDMLVFTNTGDVEHIVNGPDEAWTSGPIPAGGSFTLLLEENTPLTFSGTAPDEAAMEGEISYEAGS